MFAQKSAPPRKLRVIVAADQPLTRAALARLLEHHGHRVTMASSATEAVAAMHDAPADCMVLALPEDDATRLTDAVRDRERDSGRQLAVVGVVSQRMSGANMARTDDCVTEPAAETALLAALQHVRGADSRSSESTNDDVRRQGRAVQSADGIAQTLASLPLAAVLLNQDRQIVFANPAVADVLPRGPADVLGIRFGNAVNCRHSSETTGGCGSTVYCAECGANRAIREAQEGTPASHECRITSRALGEDLDLRVWARPLAVAGERFSLVTFMDISHEKRREALERLFFHDVINTAGGIRGMASLLPETVGEERDALVQSLGEQAGRLIDELRSQQIIAEMERGELRVMPATISSLEVIRHVAESYRYHEVAAGRTIVIDPRSENIAMRSDLALLRRVLSNMTKNALEAAHLGQTVTLSSIADATRVYFRVHNPTVMPANVQLQLFQRSFSTKGRGRGLGTYSMKLLSERYLGGEVRFRSTDEEGTTFIATYPRTLEART